MATAQLPQSAKNASISSDFAFAIAALVLYDLRHDELRPWVDRSCDGQVCLQRAEEAALVAFMATGRGLEGYQTTRVE